MILDYRLRWVFLQEAAWSIRRARRRSALDLDSLYGRGPALDPFLYVFPSSAPSTAIKSS